MAQDATRTTTSFWRLSAICNKGGNKNEESDSHGSNGDHLRYVRVLDYRSDDGCWSCQDREDPLRYYFTNRADKRRQDINWGQVKYDSGCHSMLFNTRVTKLYNQCLLQALT